MMTNKQSPWRNPWLLGWFGLLGVFLIANFIMIYLAVTNRPGLVVDDYYERGQDYEQNMLKRQARNPGWQMELRAPKAVGIGTVEDFSIQITDKQNNAVTPDEVVFYAYRPADARQDFFVPMRKQGPGVYQADVSFPKLGVWDILVSASYGGDEYHVAHRVSAGVN